MQYRRPACAVHADRSQAKGATVITCNRKSILCHEANVALIKEAFQHVVKKHPLRIRAFVLLPIISMVFGPLMQKQGMNSNLLGFALLNQTLHN